MAKEPNFENNAEALLHMHLDGRISLVTLEKIANILGAFREYTYSHKTHRLIIAVGDLTTGVAKLEKAEINFTKESLKL